MENIIDYSELKVNPRVTIIGEYKFISPYHKRKTYLPFTVLGVDRELQEANCETVEYKGKIKKYINDWWAIDNILEMIEKGTLIKTN